MVLVPSSWYNWYNRYNMTCHITEFVWSYYRRDQLYDSDLRSIRIDYGKDGVHVIHIPKSIKFPAKFNYGTAEKRMVLMEDDLVFLVS